MPIITSTTVINVLNKDNVEYRIAVGSAMRVVKVRIFAATAQVQAYIERFDLTLEPLWLYEDEFEEVVRDAKNVLMRFGSNAISGLHGAKLRVRFLKKGLDRRNED
jgi:hypothetical protein